MPLPTALKKWISDCKAYAAKHNNCSYKQAMTALKKLKKSRKSYRGGGHSDLNGSSIEAFSGQEGMNASAPPSAPPKDATAPADSMNAGVSDAHDIPPPPNHPVQGGGGGASIFEAGAVQQNGGRRRRRRGPKSNKRSRGQSQNQSQNGGKRRKSRRGRGRRRSSRGGSLSYSQY